LPLSEHLIRGLKKYIEAKKTVEVVVQPKSKKNPIPKADADSQPSDATFNESVKKSMFPSTSREKGQPLNKDEYEADKDIGCLFTMAGGAMAYLLGAGARVAATGVSTVASWVAGGGSGSYMAGLSTIGGYFGGNAILGASILNGISLGTVGAGTSYASLSLLGKVSIFTAISASSLDGVFYFSNPETNKLEYKIKVSVPKELGSKNTRDLVNDIYKTNDEFNQAVENNDPLRQKHFAEIKEANNKYALDLLEYFLNNQENNQEDLLVLGIIAWNNGKYEQFSNAMNKINKSKLNNVK
jgi:hypothetical protein